MTDIPEDSSVDFVAGDLANISPQGDASLATRLVVVDVTGGPVDTTRPTTKVGDFYYYGWKGRNLRCLPPPPPVATIEPEDVTGDGVVDVADKDACRSPCPGNRRKKGKSRFITTE